jgi:hypothetical protein
MKMVAIQHKAMLTAMVLRITLTIVPMSLLVLEAMMMDAQFP